MKTILTNLIIILSAVQINSQSTSVIFLSGTGKDDPAKWEFYCTSGQNSGKWTTIDVPSCWELKGFGTYNYGDDKVKSSEKGLYKYRFTADSQWKGKKVVIVFEGSMTDTEVKINGRPAGEIHQGAFYSFKYDISALLNYGKTNLLEVTVSKMSNNISVNEAERNADYWIFGGIFRPVFLQIKPKISIDRVAINARSDGGFSAGVYFNQTGDDCQIETIISDLNGNIAGKSLMENIPKNSAYVFISDNIQNIKTWHPEHPNLYQATFRLIQNNKIIHQHTERFGFRTIELRKRDGIYVNGIKTKFKGVNRHSFYPSSGRTTSKQLSILDVQLMKEMNMNAVRMSHYPPDKHFLDACDSLGLFVIDELAGWQWPPYDTKVGKKLVHEMIIHDVNHPAIVLWSNGNEGGFNFDLDSIFYQFDPQKRHVIHPWSVFDGTDTQHYKPYNYGTGSLFNGREVFFPTEFLHGLYDGGNGAGLSDHWDLMIRNPLSAGGFLWCLLDEGVVRTDKNDSIDCDGNHAPDGILGPYRQKEGSFYAIKEIWSPVYISTKQIAPSFNGKIEVENRYDVTSLKTCSFSWEIKSFKPEKSLIGIVKTPDIEPGEKGIIKLDLPDKWRDFEVLYLKAADSSGNEIYTWSWPIQKPSEIARKILKFHNLVQTSPILKDNEKMLEVEAAGIQYRFDKYTGILIDVKGKDGLYGINNGPVFVDRPIEVLKSEYSFIENKFVFSVEGQNNYSFTWIIYPDGLCRLEYQCKPEKESHFYGISFSYPEEQIKSLNFLGNGPFRVYKNRMKGVSFNLWNKEYNNTITGLNWEYPEFKGYYSNFYYGSFTAKSNHFNIITETEDIFLRLFTPENPVQPGYTVVPYPKGDLSFLHAISAVGTKFDPATNHGPQGQLNMFNVYHETIAPPLKGILWFDFRE